jgi:hypothetical protein
MDGNLIRIQNRVKGGAFVLFLATRRTLAFLSGCLGSPKTVC